MNEGGVKGLFDLLAGMAHVLGDGHGAVCRFPCAETPVVEFFEVPVRSVAPPCLIENEVFWRTSSAERSF